MAASPAAAPVPLDAVHREFGTVLQPHCSTHELHVIGMLVRGRGHYRTAGCIHPDRAPWLALVPAGDEDEFGLTGPLESWYVQFRWPGMELAPHGETELSVRWAGRRSVVPRVRALAPGDVAAATRLFETTRSGLARQDLAGELAARAALMDLVGIAAEGTPGEAAIGGHRGVAQLKELLQRHACEDVSIDDLAAKTRMTADHLRGLFRERFGLTPVAYRTAVRMARARELLTSTTFNVGEVARRTGYADRLYFSRAFRHHFGIAPGEMMRRATLRPPDAAADGGTTPSASP